MANNIKWSVQNVSKFYGEPGQNPNSHLMEFEDFLRAIAPNPDNDERATNVINQFTTTLKNKARTWFEMCIGENERRTPNHWIEIKRKFKEEFHPLGSTREQRVKAWKDMKWDPTKDTIDDFAFKYKELGLSLGLNEDNIFDYFKACIPGQYFVFVYSVNNMADAVSNLKKCIAAGPMIPTGLVQSQATASSVTVAEDKPKFMAVQDDFVSQFKDSLEEVVSEKVEDGLVETREMVDQMLSLIHI